MAYPCHKDIQVIRLYTNPAAEKGTVQISPVQKKTVIFNPLKTDGQADGNPMTIVCTYTIVRSTYSCKNHKDTHGISAP